mmetsp:Transcript_33730/g.53977  ORF Transcript_33730/g.53977 Transcript_33730/m.53977 type:complete len:392 (-) Transcript_33730:18-1193(-)
MAATTETALNISTTDAMQEEAVDVCDTPGEITSLVFRIIFCLLIMIPLGVYALILYQRLHRQKLREKKPSPKFLHCTNTTYYVIHLVYFFALLMSGIFDCTGMWSLFLGFANLITLSYVLHWIFVIMIYLARLRFVFQATSLAITRRYICNFVCLAISFLLLAIIVQISRRFFFSWVFVVIGWVISFLSAGAISLALSLMFIRKLFQLNLEKHVLDAGTDSVSDKEQVNQKASRIVALMTRYTVMSIASTVSTLLFIIWMCFIIADTDAVWLRTVANVLNVLDMTVDFVVMSFGFSFADTLYFRFCGSCHSCMERSCASMTDRRREVQLAKLASVEEDYDSRGAQSPSTNLSAGGTHEEPTMNSTVNGSEDAGTVTVTQSAAKSEDFESSA